MKPAHAVLVACLLLAGSAALAANDGDADAAPSTTLGPPGDVGRLIIELGHPDAATREAATNRLREMGKAALPALKEAAKDADPEVRSRAEALVRRLERRPFPGGPYDRGPRRGVQRVTFGDKVVTVDQGDRQFEIVKEDDGSIRVTVTAMEEGQRVTETYAAADEAELRELEPEAHKVYERWATMPVGGAIEIRAGQLIIDNRIVGPRVPDEFDALRARLEEQMREHRVAANQRREVLVQLDRLQAVRQGDIAVGPDQPDRRVKEFFRLADALRAKLAELKLDAGDAGAEALPPPPGERLGVQITMNQDPMTGEVDGVVVVMVVGDSRAAKLGLREADLIRGINGNPIRSTRDIRDALAKSKGELVLDVVREGKAVKLTERVEERK